MELEISDVVVGRSSREAWPGDQGQQLLCPSVSYDTTAVRHHMHSVLEP